MVREPVAGSGSSSPGPGQQLPAHPIQLADMAPPEAAQKGPQGGWRLDHAADGASRPAGAQRVVVVDAVSSGQSRSHQRHHLVAGVGSPRRISQVNVVVDQFTQTQVLGEGDRQDQPSIGHQAVVVEGNVDAVGLLRWYHLLSAPGPGSVLCFRNHYPRTQEHLLAPSARRGTHLFGGLGVSQRRKEQRSDGDKK